MIIQIAKKRRKKSPFFCKNMSALGIARGFLSKFCREKGKNQQDGLREKQAGQEDNAAMRNLNCRYVLS